MNKKYVIPEKSLRKQASEDNITHVTVAAAIIRDGELLLVRRVPEDFMGGHYELPGGHIDENETLQAALEREIVEETGLTIEAVTGMIEGFDYFEENNDLVRQFNFVVTVNDGEVRLAPAEHDHHIWIADTTIDEVILSPEMKKVVMNYFGKNST